MKKYYSVVSLLLAFLMVLPSVPVFATVEDEEHAVLVKDGLVAHYDGVFNTEDGHLADTAVWADLAGENDIPLTLTEKTYFTEDALHLSGAQFDFPEALLDVVNANEFTFELKVGTIAMTGSSYTTMVNSQNDNFALFLRSDGDYVEFKNGGNARPKVAGGKDYVENSTLSLVFSVTDGFCAMYIDGYEIGRVAIGSTINATAPFFFGHTESSKAHTADYEGMRFYNRALSAKEVAQNAKADGNYDPTVIVDRPFTKTEQSAPSVIGDLAFVAKIDSAEKFAALKESESKPASAIYYLSSTLELTDKEGTALGGLDFDDVVGAALPIIPVFYVSDGETAENLMKACAEIGLVDFSVMSSRNRVLKQVRETYGKSRAILDMTETFSSAKKLSARDVHDIIRAASMARVETVVLPRNVAYKEDLNAISEGQIVPWVWAEGELSGKTDALWLLLSGARGIISDNTALLSETAATSLVQNTLTTAPLNVGHRGTYASISGAPENTVENAIVAYENGANAVEVDIFMTKDGVIVLHHDSGTGKKMKAPDGSSSNWSIENNSYEFLSSLYYTGYYEKDENGEDVEYTGYHISTLEALLAEFKDKDMRFVIEIKSSKSVIVPALKALIDRYDVLDQCMVITFPSTGQLDDLMTYFPELAVGSLLGTSSSASDPEQALYYTLKDSQPTNAIPDLNYSGYGAGYVRAATMRGIPVMGWTINDTAKIYRALLDGLTGITTDNAHVLGALAKSITAKTPYQTVPGSSVTVDAEVVSYAREALEGEIELIVIEGEELVASADGLTLQLVEGAEGVVTYMVSYTQTLSTGESYTIYTQPQWFFVSEETLEEPEEPETSDVSHVIITGNDGVYFENVADGDKISTTLQLGIYEGFDKTDQLFEEKDLCTWILATENGMYPLSAPIGYDKETNIYTFLFDEDSAFLPEGGKLYTFLLMFVHPEYGTFMSSNTLTVATGKDLVAPHTHQWSSNVTVTVKPTVYDSGKGMKVCDVCGANSEPIILDRVPFVTGDLNMDGTTDISDVTSLLSYLASGKSEQLAMVRTQLLNGEILNYDQDEQGGVDISDVTALLKYLSGSKDAIVGVPTIVQNGLVAWYDGNDHTDTHWTDKAGDNDIEITSGAFANGALVLDGTQVKIPSDVYDAVRGSAYTIELNLGNFKMNPTTSNGYYTTWLYNSGSEKVALFIQNNNRQFSAKISGQSSGTRPSLANAEYIMQGGTLTVTYEAGGRAKMYLNGILMSDMAATASNGNDGAAAGSFFYLGATGAKASKTEYQGLRFYNRALSAAEVANNAKIDGASATIVRDGLVTWYDGDIYSGEEWTDLMGNNTLDTQMGTFENGAYHLAEGEAQYLPTGVIGSLQGEEFTIEMNLGAFELTGTNYTTWLSSFPTGNSEKLSLYVQNSSSANAYYAKVSGFARGKRPTIANASTTLQDATITITFKAGGKAILYLNGIAVSTVDATATTDHGNITSLLLGHTAVANSGDTHFEGLRFYNRALGAEEVYRNYLADCARDTVVAE